MQDRNTFRLLSDAEIAELPQPELLRYFRGLVALVERLEQHLELVMEHLREADDAEF